MQALIAVILFTIGGPLWARHPASDTMIAGKSGRAVIEIERAARQAKLAIDLESSPPQRDCSEKEPGRAPAITQQEDVEKDDPFWAILEQLEEEQASAERAIADTPEKK